jgi:hypothetical protein
MLVFLMVLAIPALAASPWEATSLAVGGQAVWFERGAATFNRDLEGVLNGSMSLTPHLSLVGQGAWGFENHYGRGTLGARITATDVNDQDFSIGIGLGHQWLTEIEAGQDEWVADASVGWKPLKTWNFILGAQATYGIESQSARTAAGFRIPFKIGGSR